MTEQAVASTELSKRNEIVRQAYEVFYKKGFHATAVDRVLADSGISKRTVYKYFRSKEELIVATIAHYRHITFEAIAEELEKRTSDPKQKILAIFDLKREALERGEYSGCFAINAKLEYEGKEPEIEAACAVFLDDLGSFIDQLCKQARFKNPNKVMKKIMILLEGAIVYGQAQRDPQIAQLAKDMAVELLAQK